MVEATLSALPKRVSPAVPIALLAIVIIVIDGLVIYGFVEHADYFQGSPRAGVDVAELERLAQVLDEGLEVLSVLPRHL